MKKIKHLYFANQFDIEKGKHLYKLLKRDFYYETVNLYERLAVAEFETDKLEERIVTFVDVINNLKPDQNINFEAWLASIDFRILPKKVVLPEEIRNVNQSDNGKSFITNLRTSEKYFLEEVNYFVDFPVQLLLLSMLWSVTVGVLLDRKLGAGCLGQRLNIRKGDDFKAGSFTSFKYYLPDYNKWRDQAIKIGLENLESGNDILLMALDIKQCFYFLKTDWGEIQEVIENSTIHESDKNFCKKITNLLLVVHSRYFNKANKYLRITHPRSKDIPQNQSIGLPIGLPSSRILSNWELSFLDSSIIKKLRPIYYGRYVDDFLIVLNNPGREDLLPNIIIENFFIKTGILENDVNSNDSEEKIYKILGSKNDKARFEYLEIQKKKLIFHFYAHEGSWAGLSEFQNELNKQASEFRFLPVKEDLSEFMDDAYDINFEGSKNKLRSVIGVKENSTKLSNQLYARILKYWLGQQGLGRKEKEQLMRFYQGRNIFEYARTWERVFTLFVGTHQVNECAKYYQEVSEVLNQMQPFISSDENVNVSLIEDSSVINKTRKDVIVYLNIALSSALSFESVETRKRFYENYQALLDTKIIGWAESFRVTHMVRQQFVRWPLLEYLNSDMNLINFDFDSPRNDLILNWDQSFEYAPRFIYFHEYALFLYLKKLLLPDEKFRYEEVLEKYKNVSHVTGSQLTIKDVQDKRKEKKGETEISRIEIKDDFKRKGKLFCIGVANIKVFEKNIKASYKTNAHPNLSLDRQEELFQIVNEAIRYPQCDLVVLPEVSIPYMWLPFMANISRKHNIGMAFGLEHLVVNNIAYNQVVTILPYKKGNVLENCFISIRTKNHYSPEEIIDLKSYGYEIPESNLYEKIFWRNCWFSVYNCFELTDINARGLFRSELDLLVSIVWNHDVNYYSNIIESTARDLHLYIAQANTSDYGDSRIVAPRKTEEKDILRVKGGENSVLLKGFIDIEELRDFQNHAYIQKDHRFKPTPAGFEHEKARKRSI